MKKLWQKNWQLDPKVEAFETKGDLLLDQKLVKFDVLGSKAHALGLVKIGILTKEEYKKLEKGLGEIMALNKASKFILQPGDEDIHTKIENYLTDKYGEVGKKIHTGRSRNDQVLTALALFSKEQLQAVLQETMSLIGAIANFSKKFGAISMPGYTHMQKAMPSSVGLWADSFVSGFVDDLVVLKTALELVDQSPLGSGAGYGVPLSLDKEYTAKLLGFNKVQQNSLYCQNSRGKIAGVIVAALTTVLFDINKLATDILLFTTAEFNFFTVADELCTGSSIMPQKKNVDVAELLKSKVHLLIGNYVQIMSLSSNLLSGYNRDLQESKKPLFESFEITLDSLEVAKILVKNLTPNKEVLKKAITAELFATKDALDLVKKGMSFRNAYKQVAKKTYEK